MSLHLHIRAKISVPPRVCKGSRGGEACACSCAQLESDSSDYLTGSLTRRVNRVGIAEAAHY
jgi:hypothetical protein